MDKMTFKRYVFEIMPTALAETLYMVFISAIISTILGSIIGIILVVSNEKGLMPNKIVYKTLAIIINIFRSFPFLILIFALIPFTRAIMKTLTSIGTTTGNTAAIIPLTIAAAPFIARIIENALMEVNFGIIEAAKSLGLKNRQIIFKVMIKEASPSIVLGLTLATITLIGYSSMVGALGAGGLGSVAYSYGYVNFDQKAMLFTVITIILLVQIIQLIGNGIYKKIK